MNIFLWVLQILLALHTAVGAVWKFTQASHGVPSLEAIPHAAWLALAALEILFSVALVAGGFDERFKKFAPLAAIAILLEMVLFCGLHLSAGSADRGPMIYWLVVAALSLVIAFGRLARKRAA